MAKPLPAVIRLADESPAGAAYDNHVLAAANDHVVRIGTMTGPYHWHSHPDSDEVFLVLEGGLYIDFEDGTVEVPPGHLITVPRNVRHRTRPMGDRSVNLTFERAAASTIPHA